MIRLIFVLIFSPWSLSLPLCEIHNQRISPSEKWPTCPVSPCNADFRLFDSVIQRHDYELNQAQAVPSLILFREQFYWELTDFSTPLEQNARLINSSHEDHPTLFRVKKNDDGSFFVGIDAAVADHRGNIIFFKDTQVWLAFKPYTFYEYEKSLNNVLELDYENSPSKVDAALITIETIDKDFNETHKHEQPNKKETLFMFKGSTMWAFDYNPIKLTRLDSYPLNVSELHENFPQITSATQVDNEVYLFVNDQYFTVDVKRFPNELRDEDFAHPRNITDLFKCPPKTDFFEFESAASLKDEQNDLPNDIEWHREENILSKRNIPVAESLRREEIVNKTQGFINDQSLDKRNQTNERDASEDKSLKDSSKDRSGLTKNLKVDNESTDSNAGKIDNSSFSYSKDETTAESISLTTTTEATLSSTSLEPSTEFMKRLIENVTNEAETTASSTTFQSSEETTVAETTTDTITVNSSAAITGDTAADITMSIDTTVGKATLTTNLHVATGSSTSEKITPSFNETTNTPNKNEEPATNAVKKLLQNLIVVFLVIVVLLSGICLAFKWWSSHHNRYSVRNGQTNSFNERFGLLKNKMNS